jgi:Rrf2 family iron-sulfur cluster assembly transcriptional regulator
MIYSRSSEYAFRALTHLAAQPAGGYFMVKDIAKTEEIPTHFLAKILQQLARKGLLRSSKGPSGGFALRRPAREVTLLEIVDALEGTASYHQCAVGLADCTDQMACPLHDSWKMLREQILEYLSGNTIGDLAIALEGKKKNLARGRRSNSRSKPATRKRRA